MSWLERREQYSTPEMIPKEGLKERINHLLGVDIENWLQSLRNKGLEVANVKKRRSEIIAYIEAGEARFGTRGHFDHERKSFLHGIIESRRAELQAEGKKVVESYLDSYAHAHPEYKSWLSQQYQERLIWHGHRADLAQTEAELEEALAELEYVKQTVRLNEELLRFLRAEAGLTN